MPSNFIAITLRHGCSPANLLHIFRTTFLKNTSGWLRIKKETLALVFSYEFCEIFKNTFFTDHLWTTTSNCLLLKTTRVASFISKA